MSNIDKIQHSEFIIKNGLEPAFIGLSMISSFPIYSVSKCIYLLEESGYEKLNALQIINNHIRDTLIKVDKVRMRDLNENDIDYSLFCFDLLLKKEI